VVAELIGDGASRIDHRPVRAVRRISLIEHALRLLQLACVRQRLAIGGEDFAIARVFDRDILQHRRRLIVEIAGPQRFRIGHRDFLVIGMGFVALAQLFGKAPQIFRRGRCRLRGRADRGRHIVETDGLAA
jgi:hypothetical protein